jgi:glutamate-1-semialdehyde 2,1-aminomutase
MKRFKPDAPANISFARGTFNSHPHVMACMSEFLQRIRQPEVQSIYRQADALWNERVDQLNQQLKAAQLPVRLANLHSIITVLYTEPCRYNWMLQFYLRAEGLELSWIGSGRMIMSLNYSDQDFAEVASRFLRAARQMQADAWFWTAPHLTNRWIKRQMLKDMLAYRFGAQRAGRRSAVAQTNSPVNALADTL